MCDKSACLVTFGLHLVHAKMVKTCLKKVKKKIYFLGTFNKGQLPILKKKKSHFPLKSASFLRD